MENLIVIRSKVDLDALVLRMQQAEYIAVDTETTGLEKDAQIIGISVCDSLDTAFYVILLEWDPTTKQLVPTEAHSHVNSLILTLQQKALIMHNAVFDCQIINSNFKQDLMPQVHTDTMILAHLLDENRPVGLKELGTIYYGEDTKIEQNEMKESIKKNGGSITKVNYELFKGDAELIGKYGAKDALLTLKLFFTLVPELYEQNLSEFFYEKECMPLLRGPTYQLNTTGLRVDLGKLNQLKSELEAEILDAKAFIYKEISPLVASKYPGTSKKTEFNIGSGKQLAWLLFIVLGNTFHLLTKEGKTLCKALNLRLPYSFKDKREFLHMVTTNKDRVWEPARFNPKTKKMSRPKKIGNVWNYLAVDKVTMSKFAKKYKWVERYLEYTANLKILNTYVIGIQDRLKYSVIRPSFLQTGTTSGRYSSRNPNFQNLPRKDRRVKTCIISREGKTFVGADYSQLEPRIFASLSQDERLLQSFENGDDFYSVIGAEVFDKSGCSLKKDEKNSFAALYPDLRDISKVIALSATYGTTAPKLAPVIDKSIDDAQMIIQNYFERFPKVQKFMNDCHKEAKTTGQVLSLYGRPRRIPLARNIAQVYKNAGHSDLPYEIRSMLNLAVNHVVQGTAASIMNRASIKFTELVKNAAKMDPKWNQVSLVMQIHDELIVEAPTSLSEEAAKFLKLAMESTSTLPGVKLVAEPKIATNIADLK